MVTAQLEEGGKYSIIKPKQLTKKELAKVESKVKRKPKLKKTMGGSIKGGIKKVYSSISSSKKITKRRATGTRSILTAAGILSTAKQSKAGRPVGSYKYGMPISKYKKLMSKRSALYSAYSQEQKRRLSSKGFSGEQVKELQAIKTADQVKVPVNESIANEELRFQNWISTNTVSPNTQRILDDIQRVQNKGKSDNIEQQRRNREKQMVGNATNLMNAHKNMTKTEFDVTGIREDNILLAPSRFRENPEENILRTKKLNILQTREAGNQLFI